MEGAFKSVPAQGFLDPVSEMRDVFTIVTFLPILRVGNQGQQQLVVYLGSLLGIPCQQLRRVFLISGVGVPVR